MDVMVIKEVKSILKFYHFPKIKKNEAAGLIQYDWWSLSKLMRNL